MGCELCRKEFQKEDVKMDEEPAPTKIIETDGKKDDIDIQKKKKFAEFLLSNDLKIFQKYLSEVQNLSDEDFIQLFDGNTQHNYKVANLRNFKQIAQKFDDNKEFLYECYENTNYYKYALQIWRPNILQGLKDAEGKGKMEMLKKYKIDLDTWDPEIRSAFETIINSPSTTTLAERMQNYMKADYGNFDELIKSVDKCKKTIGKDDKSFCNKTLTANLETSMTNIINLFVPNFMKQLSEGIDSIPSILKEGEKKKALKQVNDAYLTASQRKRLITKVKEIYSKKNESNSFEDYSSEYQKLKNLGEKFNKENENKAFGYGSIHFKKMGFEEKAGSIFSNKKIKHAVLGLSVANLAYSVMHLTKTFQDYNSFSEQFRFRLNEIRQRFIKHQGEVKVITEETDVDQAVELIVECGKKFQQDLEDVEELISDITNAMSGVQNEKNKTILNIIGSTGGTILGLFGAAVTKGSDRVEYATASLADVLALAANSTDLATQNKALKEYDKYLKEANKLKNDIIKEIDKLREKFNSLSGKHFT